MPTGLMAATRLERARAVLDELQLDALLVSRPALSRWLSGFALRPGEETTSGWSGTLLLAREAQVVLVDGRYLEQATQQCPGWTVRRTHGPMHEDVPVLAGELGAHRLGAEAQVLSHERWSALAEAGLELLAADSSLTGLRLRKDPDELDAIERACAVTDACFQHLLAFIRPGLTERRVARELTTWFEDQGAEALAFEPLVLAGPRAAMPHGHATDAPVRAGEALLIDFGCQVEGYRSDMTRTVFIDSEPDIETRRRYDAVLAAQQLAFEAATPGLIGSALDGVARQSLSDAGLGEAFLHGLGHGIGLETHEDPIMRTSDRPLEVGMVFTLEPGVYFPGELGIRIEDVVVLESGGPRRLTNAPREVLVI